MSQSLRLNPHTGELTGGAVVETVRLMGDMAGVYRDEAARAAIDPARIVYRVQAYEPVSEATPGAICCATTFLEPGMVGDEYIMTRGHYHVREDRPELEVTVSGAGTLVLMDTDRRIHIEPMSPGSVHHVPSGTAHRVANTGSEPLVFVSYWASETGHDYETIRRLGFSARVLRVDGLPQLVPQPGEP
jgi:glucose-6-phosphate isomerase